MLMRAVHDGRVPKAVMDYRLVRLPDGVTQALELPLDELGRVGESERFLLDVDLEYPDQRIRRPHFYRVGWSDELGVVVVAGPSRRAIAR